MSVRGGEGTEHCTTTAAIAVTYWATESERVYAITAARIRGKRALIRRDIPCDRIVLKSEPPTFLPSEEPPMSMKDFVVQKLTTFKIAADGTRVRINFISEDGDQTCLTLPTESLAELIMTLPRMMRQSLRARYQDENLRLVYSADTISIEQSSDSKTVIVTLATPDGFEVSFGLTRQQMTVFGDAVRRLNAEVIQTTVFN